MPHIGGSDVAGVVDATGPGAKDVPIGLRVVVDPSISYRWYEGPGRGESFEPSPFQIIGEHTLQCLIKVDPLFVGDND